MIPHGAAPHQAKLRVLVVDDDSALRRMVALMLEDAEYEVLEARDGLEALAALRSDPGCLVVLLDWMMPKMSGEDVLLAVEADPELANGHAFVLITANSAAFSPRMANLLSKLSVPVLSKPFGMQELLRSVESEAKRIVGV